MNKIHHILTRLGFLLFLLLAGVLVYAKEPRPFLLGGGGSNFSNLRKGRNGLLTGTYSQEHHLFGVYVDGAYSALMSNMSSVKPTKGYGIGGGVCYEFQYYHFKMQVGFGMRWQDVTNTVADTFFTDNYVRDARGYPYHLHYHFYDRVDRATQLHAQVPILFGAGYSNWYFLAGVKLNLTMNMCGWTRVAATGTTSGTYDQFLGEFYEMDNHGFRKNVPMTYQDKRLELKPDVLLSFETGYEWGKDAKFGTRYNPNKGKVHPEYRLRIAAFVDYSIPNIMPQTGLALYDIPAGYKWDFPAFHSYHVYSSHDALGNKLHNLYAGIKLTALIGFYMDHQCVLCGDYTTEAWMSSPKIRPKHRRSNGYGK